jgi:branched-chain amino acid transport system permease protein
MAQVLPRWTGDFRRTEWLLLLALVLVPLMADDFWLVQIGARAFILGLIALGLTLLAGYGGMVSLAQMTVAGVAAYAVAILTTTDTGWTVSLPFALALPLALVLAVLAATAIGWIAVRTTGIYTIMITLAIAVVFFYFTRQNYAVFNGFTGYAQVAPPALGDGSWRDPLPFYYLSMVAAVLGYGWIRQLVRAPFGLALQGVRDEPRRLESLGFNVRRHRILAYSVAGVLAGVGGVLLVWFNTRIDPSTVGVDPVIDILVIAVIGGLSHPIGAFVGALAFVLIDTFAVDLLPGLRERFNLIIGLFFLLIVLFSPDGLIGLGKRVAAATRDEREG